ncbi:MAG: hypothetical protein AAGA54_02065 [Myxococcota bacterium]
MARSLAWALAAAFALVAPGCNEDAPPVKAAKDYANAVRARDTETILKRVDAKTLAYVQASAERASDQIGGRRSVAPSEMLQVVDVDPRFQVVEAHLVAESGDMASVKLVGADGTEHQLQLVLEDGAWKVALPTPAAPTSPL